MSEQQSAEPPVPLGAGERHEILDCGEEAAMEYVCSCGEEFVSEIGALDHARESLRTLLDESRAALAGKTEDNARQSAQLSSNSLEMYNGYELIKSLRESLARLTAERDAATQRATHAETDRGIAEEELKVFKEYVAVNEASLREMGVKLLQRTAAAHAAGRREALSEAAEKMQQLGWPSEAGAEYIGEQIRALLSEAP